MITTKTLHYQQIVLPIVLMVVAQLLMDIVWRVSNIAQWCSEPKVRRSIILGAYDTVLHHDYSFFQNQFSGAISSKIKGILDGYDRFWEEMHRGLLICLLRVVLGVLTLFWIYINLVINLISWFLVIWI